MNILVTGATGYVGTRLIPELLKRGHHVRCLARSTKRISMRPWFDQVEVAEGDVLDATTLPNALKHIDTAYYLVHNMSSGWKYREHEKIGAENFGRAAHASGLSQIIYVGGLGQGQASRHMASRRAVGDALRASGVPITELRASVIIGSGSISFEMIRCITDWFPLVPAPLQTNVPGQPIATRDLLTYLLAVLDHPAALNQIYEVGSSDALPYPELMLTYARLRGLTRGKLPLPFFNAILSAAVADKLTPVPFTIARPLMEELVAPSVVTDHTARSVFADIQPLSYAEAVKLALARAELPADSPWMESLVTRHPLTGSHVRTLGEGLLIYYRERKAEARSEFLKTDKRMAGWLIAAQKAGEWIRYRNARGLPGVLYHEIQLKSGALRTAILFEPRGLIGMLFWHLNIWRWYVRGT